MIYKVKRFSSDLEKEDIETMKNIAIGGGATIGIDASGKALQKGLDSVNRSAQRSSRGIYGNETNTKTFKNLKKYGEKKGFHFEANPEFLEGHGAEANIKINRGFFAKEIRKRKKASPGFAREAAEYAQKIYPKGKKSTIFLKDVNKGHSHTIAHEMGHALNGGTRLGKIGLKGQLMGLKVGEELLGTGAGPAIGFLYGAGMKERENQTGKKQSKLSKAAPTAIVATSQVPILANEAAASVRGYKLLKKAGASKSLLRASRNTFGKNLGTYAITAAAPVIAVGGAQIAGHYLAKGLRGDKKKEDKK